MKYLANTLIALALLSNAEVIHAQPPTDAFHQNTIHWHTSYDSALRQARERHQPLLLFFTGSDWCTWCHKLEEEVLGRREFADAMGNVFVFVRLDFPMNRKLPNWEQNQRLSNKYEIKSYPTVLILDEQEHIIGKTGYQAGGVQHYVAHLNGLTKNSLFEMHRRPLEQMFDDSETADRTPPSARTEPRQTMQNGFAIQP